MNRALRWKWLTSSGFASANQVPLPFRADMRLLGINYVKFAVAARLLGRSPRSSRKSAHIAINFVWCLRASRIDGMRTVNVSCLLSVRKTLCKKCLHSTKKKRNLTLRERVVYNPCEDGQRQNHQPPLVHVRLASSYPLFITVESGLAYPGNVTIRCIL